MFCSSEGFGVETEKKNHFDTFFAGEKKVCKNTFFLNYFSVIDMWFYLDSC